MTRMQLPPFSVVVTIVYLMSCSAEGNAPSHPPQVMNTDSIIAGSSGTGIETAGTDITNEGSSGFNYRITPSAGTEEIIEAEPLGEDNDICAEVNITVNRTILNIILVVDRSTTMVMEPFGVYVTRWAALREALLGKDGLIPQYQENIRFGYEGYTGFSGTEEEPGICPDLVSVEYDLNNLENITPAFDESAPVPFGEGKIGQTPTGESLELVVDKLEKVIKEADPEEDLGPFIILLATDGAPDTCEDPWAEMFTDQPDRTGPPMQLVVDQAERANKLGIKTYVLSVGNEVGDEHLQDVANAGIGTSDAPFWKADNDVGLKDALNEIVGSAASCELVFDAGRLTDSIGACQDGEVVLNETPLACSDEDGWRVVDPTHIELVGPACESFKESFTSELSAQFPCEVIVR